MSTKASSTTTATWREAMDAGVLPHEHIETIKLAMQQIYPDSLDKCTLDEEIMKDIDRMEPRADAEDGIAPMALNFEGAAGVAGAEVVPETPIAARAGSRKRVAGAALEHIRYTPQPDKLEARMSDAKRTAVLKQRGQFMDQEANITKVEVELRRIFDSEFGTELTLRSKGRINSRDVGYGFQLYWFAYQTQVIRMTMHRYNDMQEVMQFMTVTGKYSAPQDVMIQLDRYFEAFEEAGRKMSEFDKERTFIKAIQECFGAETSDYVRGLPRIWNLNKKDYTSNFDMIRSAIVLHVGDRQRWPGTATPSKIKVTKTEDSKDSPLADELQEMKAQLLKLTQAINGKTQGAKKPRQGFEPRGLRRAPEAADSKSMWADNAPCAFHSKIGAKAGPQTHTNAECKMRDVSDPSYAKSHDEAIKKFMKK
jgi:hypothetical protein